MQQIESLVNLISQDINDEYGYAKYLSHDVIIMKKNGYINMTKLCDQYGKAFRNWKQNKSSQELIEFIAFAAGIPAANLFVTITEG